MKINLDYTFKYSDEELKKLDEVKSEVTIGYITNAINQKYKEGLEGQLRRTFGRIQRKLDAAIEDKTYTVNFEEAEKDFIKKAFEEAKYPVNAAKYVDTFEDEFINKLYEEKPTKPAKQA